MHFMVEDSSSSIVPSRALGEPLEKTGGGGPLARGREAGRDSAYALAEETSVILWQRRCEGCVGGVVGGSGSVCLGSHDAHDAKDESTAGNGSSGRAEMATVDALPAWLARCWWLRARCGPGEEAFVTESSESGRGQGGRNEACSVTTRMVTQGYHQMRVLRTQRGDSMQCARRDGAASGKSRTRRLCRRGLRRVTKEAGRATSTRESAEAALWD